MDSEEPQAPPPASGFRQRPVSTPGIWTWRLVLVAVGLWFFASVVSALFGRQDEGTVPDVMKVLGPVIGIAFAATGLGAFASSVVSFTRYRERSWVVWLGLLVGHFTMLFLLGEVFVGH